MRRPLMAAVAAASLAVLLAGCQSTTSTDVLKVERAQGSQENIASLSAVIAANPQDPEAITSVAPPMAARANTAGRSTTSTAPSS